MVNIGNVKINGKTVLAPMAGVTDRAFREVCKLGGASFMVSEMASAKGLVYGNDKTNLLLQLSDSERPAAIQLFGTEPSVMAECAQMAMQFSPDIIDINMGCPAPKIVSSGAGSALMKTPLLAEQIVSAVVKAVHIPVTVKFRKGWDDSSVNAVEFSKRMEAAGAAAVAVHGRTRVQMYSGVCDRKIIADVVNAVSIPVIGNGDITSPQEAKSMLDDTGCSLVMIGRGALGRPWIFSDIENFLKDGTLPEAERSLSEKIKWLRLQAELTVKYKGEYVAIRECRKIAAWYFSGFKHAALLRKECGELSSLEQLDELCRKVESLSSSEIK